MKLQEMNQPQRTEPHPHTPPPAKPALQPAVSSQPTHPTLNHGSAPAHGSRWWIWLIIIVIVGGGGYFLLTRIRESTSSATAAGARGGARAVPVVAGVARKGDMPVYLTGLGTVTAFQTVTIHSRVDGELMKVYFKEGELVKQGDPLVEIDQRPFQVMVTQAEGQLAKDEALLENAKLDLSRFQSIRESITQQQIDTQKALISQYAGTVKTDQGQLDNARLQLSYCKINSPISGRIGLRLVDEGNLVHASDSNGLLVVTQFQPIAINFYLREDDIQQVFQKLNAGQKLQVDALDHDANTLRATGTLLATDNQVDATTGTLRFKAIFSNEDNSLFPNQFVNARLLIDTLKDVVLVPAAAVQHGPDGSPFIYVARKASTTQPADAPKVDFATPMENNASAGPTSKPAEEQTVSLVNVTIGHQEGDLSVITSGIQPGDVVITDGVDKLQAGSKVTVRLQRPSATTRAAKVSATSRPAGNNGRPGGRSGRRGNS